MLYPECLCHACILILVTVGSPARPYSSDDSVSSASHNTSQLTINERPLASVEMIPAAVSKAVHVNPQPAKRGLLGWILKPVVRL